MAAVALHYIKRTFDHLINPSIVRHIFTINHIASRRAVLNAPLKPATHDATICMRLVVCGVGSKKIVVTLGDRRHNFFSTQSNFTRQKSFGLTHDTIFEPISDCFQLTCCVVSNGL